MIVEIRTTPEMEVDPIFAPTIRRVLRRLIVLARERISLDPLAGEPHIDITMVDEDEMRSLNAKYREEDRVTDVLAFPLLDDSDVSRVFDVTLLGDVVIALPVAEESAAKRNVSLLHEIVFLTCHGVLHLLGWDHRDEQSLQDMHSLSLGAMDSIFLTDHVDDWDLEGEGD